MAHGPLIHHRAPDDEITTDDVGHRVVDPTDHETGTVTDVADEDDTVRARWQDERPGRRPAGPHVRPGDTVSGWR